MRSISVTTEVFSKIWSSRRSGEDTENDILSRLLNASVDYEPDQCRPEVKTAGRVKVLGFHDDRFDFHADEGFEIFRVYKGKSYLACASKCEWILGETGEAFRSLNELSSAIGALRENAWNGWLYRDAQGLSKPVGELRKVGVRKRVVFGHSRLGGEGRLG